MNTPRKTILLFGMPRSGTTWIGKIFDSDPETLYMHEPDSWKRMGFLPLFIDGDLNVQTKDTVSQYHADLPMMRTSQVTTKLPVFRKNYQSTTQHYLHKFLLYTVNALRKTGFASGPEPILRIGESGRPYDLVWKSIESLGRLSSLSEVIDNCYSVHIVRNPAGYIASVLSGEARRNFRDSTPTSDDYSLFQMLLDSGQGRESGITLNDLKSMTPLQRLAIRWRLYNEIAYFRFLENSWA